MYFFLSSDVLISSTKSISACEVDILVRNPYWLVDSINNLYIFLVFCYIVFQEFWRTGIVEIYRSIVVEFNI